MSGDRKGLYPSYDVLALQDEWDAHTREIVNKRLEPFDIKLLTKWEQQMIKIIAAHVAHDHREEILNWVVAHVDEQLAKPFGESQRKPGILPQKALICGGLKALNTWAKGSYSREFLKLEAKQQLTMISSLQLGHLEEIKDWDTTLQKELFKKLLDLTIEAYYSHPWVWSEIGYGGPAYPRGYVRVELGITDPWEPTREEVVDDGTEI